MRPPYFVVMLSMLLFAAGPARAWAQPDDSEMDEQLSDEELAGDEEGLDEEGAAEEEAAAELPPEGASLGPALGDLIEASRPTLTNVTPAFLPGPYASLTVDPANPYRLAIGTADGHVLWSEDGGRSSKENQIIFARMMDPVTLRGEAKAELSATAESMARGSQRSLHTFLNHLEADRPPGRHAVWMTLGSKDPSISAVALPPFGPPAAVAGPSGLHIGHRGAGWIRTFGGLGPMPRKADPMGISIGVNPTNPRHVLAGTDHGLMTSHNGGHSFQHHTDLNTESEYIMRFIFDPENPTLVFAVTPEAILLSEDSGGAFEPSFMPEGEIADLNVSPEAALISASDGLHVATADGVVHLLKGQAVVGAAPWRDGTVLAATSDTLYQLDLHGTSRTILRTHVSDPFMAMGGNDEIAWLLSARNIHRLGAPVPRVPRIGYKPPRIVATLGKVERAFTTRIGLENPHDVRFHNRWYAKLLPDVDVVYRHNTDLRQQTMFDGIFPIRYRQANAVSDARDEFIVYFQWDLQELLMGHSNVSNPRTPLESGLTYGRQAILEELRWRYREASILVGLLQAPPLDPITELHWRLRLQEYASHLEFVTGIEVVADDDLETAP